MDEKILILEDEDRVLFKLYKELSKEFEVKTSLNLKDFYVVYKEFEPEVIVMDIHLPDGSALDFIRDNKINNDDVAIILISGYPEEEYLIEGIRLKVDDFIKKPFRPAELKYSIRKIIKEKNTLRANRILSSKNSDKMVFKSEKMNNLIEKAKKMASTEEPVLICGESGVGKQLLANLIHSESARKNNTFLDINCAAISETLLESQLFGHKKGAFTDARDDLKGFFELTSDGSLFLDEISEMKPELQAKLLKVVENGEFIPLGATRPVKVNSRLITATNRDMEKYIKEGKFRHDLFYRLNVFRLDIPPLRERKEDIEELAKHFFIQSSNTLNKKINSISDKVMQKYYSYSWPGNIRELKNVIHRAVLLTDGDVITKSFVDDIGDDNKNCDISREIPDSGIDLEKIVREIETDYINKALEKTRGSKSQAAKLLGISRDMLRYRIKNYNIKNI